METRYETAKLRVTLAHRPNPDVTGGYWTAPLDSGRRTFARVLSIEEASGACRRYIERNGLGGGNWAGGAVTDADGATVARISYNGRAWNPDGSAR